MEETLNLEDILEVIKKNFLMIAIMTLLFGCIAAYGTIFLMTPQHSVQTGKHGTKDPTRIEYGSVNFTSCGAIVLDYITLSISRIRDE